MEGSAVACVPLRVTKDAARTLGVGPARDAVVTFAHAQNPQGAARGVTKDGLARAGVRVVSAGDTGGIGAQRLAEHTGVALASAEDRPAGGCVRLKPDARARVIHQEQGSGGGRRPAVGERETAATAAGRDLEGVAEGGESDIRAGLQRHSIGEAVD